MKFLRMLVEIEIVPKMKDVANHLNLSMSFDGFRADFVGKDPVQYVTFPRGGRMWNIQICSLGTVQYSSGIIFLPGSSELERKGGAELLRAKEGRTKNQLELLRKAYLDGRHVCEVCIGTEGQKEQFKATIEGCCRCLLEKDKEFSSKFPKEEDKGDTVIYFSGPNFKGFERDKFSVPIRTENDLSLLSERLDFFI